MSKERMRGEIELPTVDQLLTPLICTTKSFYLFLIVLLAGVGFFLFAWYYQLNYGLIVTGMRDIPGGTPWGIYITNFIFFIGITHAGLAIASAIRILKLKDYVPVARMAELITIFSLIMAFLSIIFDLGRPDRVFNLIRYYPWRLATSPLVWDVTAIFTYLILAITYLYIELREDLAYCIRRKVPGIKSLLYGPLIQGYGPGERRKAEQIIFWASIANFPIMVMVHTTVSWIFGVIPARPGWYSAIMGPYYVAGAVLSGVASVVVVAAIYRRLFNWDGIIKPSVFRGLGNFLTVVCIVYLYFILAEQITYGYHGLVEEFEVHKSLFYLEFAWPFWAQVITLFIAFIILFVQALNPRWFSIAKTTIASAIIVITLWVTRFLIVVPPLTHTLLPYPVGIYIPTWVEWTLVGGTFILIALLFLAFTKLFPIVPITESREAGLVRE